MKTQIVADVIPISTTPTPICYMTIMLELPMQELLISEWK